MLNLIKRIVKEWTDGTDGDDPVDDSHYVHHQEKIKSAQYNNLLQIQQQLSALMIDRGIGFIESASNIIANRGKQSSHTLQPQFKLGIAAASNTSVGLSVAASSASASSSSEFNPTRYQPNRQNLTPIPPNGRKKKSNKK